MHIPADARLVMYCQHKNTTVSGRFAGAAVAPDEIYDRICYVIVRFSNYSTFNSTIFVYTVFFYFLYTYFVVMNHRRFVGF